MFGKSARNSKKESMNSKSRIILDKEFRKKKDRTPKNRRKKNNIIKVRRLTLRNLFKRHSGFFRRISYFLLTALIGGAAVYASTNLEYFNIKEVEFSNNKELKHLEDDSLERFRADALGNNFFKYEINMRVVQFEEENSIVKKAYGEKVFPDKVLITVEEREPMFTFVQDNKCLIVDDEAVLVEKEECQPEQDEETSAENPENDAETGTGTGNETLICQCIKNDRYPALIPVYLMNSYVDFENMGSSNKYLLRGFLNIRDILEEDYYVINSYVILDQSCQIEAYKATETASGKNTIFLFSLEDDLDIQIAKLKVILDYMGELDEYSVVDLRFERPVLQE